MADGEISLDIVSLSGLTRGSKERIPEVYTCSRKSRGLHPLPRYNCHWNPSGPLSGWGRGGREGLAELGGASEVLLQGLWAERQPTAPAAHGPEVLGGCRSGASRSRIAAFKEVSLTC